MIIRKYRLTLLLLIVALTCYSCKITDPGSGSSRHYINYIGETDTPGHAYAVALTHQKAFVADGAGGLRIMDISNPHFPYETNKFEGEGLVYDVKYDGNYAYLASGEEGLKIIDVETIFPEKLSSYSTRNAFGLDFAGKHIYLADAVEGIKIFDVSNVYSIRLVSSVPVSGQQAYSARVKLPYLFVGSRYGFSILDVENLINPREIAFEPMDYVYDIYVEGFYAYIAYYGGLRIYNVSDANDPEFVSDIVLARPARSVTVRGDYAYLALGGGGLSIVRVANPYQPYEIVWYNPANVEMNNISLLGRYLYIANGDRGMLTLEFWPGH